MQTTQDYAQAVKTFNLTQCYREQNRFIREIKRISCIPGCVKQVKIREDRIEIIEQRIQTLYSKPGPI